MIIIFFANLAFADGTEPEESGEGDAFATANQALGQAERAVRIAGEQSATIDDLRNRLTELEHAPAPVATIDDSVIDGAVRDLSEAVRTEAVSARTAATQAQDAATRAEEAANRAHSSAAAAWDSANAAERSNSNASSWAASASVPPTTLSLDGDDYVDRDDKDPRFYGAFGVGAAWLFREESLTGGTVKSVETDELSSGTLPALAEIGFADFDEMGRSNIGARFIGAYNVGGGVAMVGEAVFGSFLESTHSFRLEGFGGVQWETIPTDNASNYREWRYDVGLGAEFVFADEHAGLLLTGRVMPANDLDDSNAGEVSAIVRARF